MFGLERKPHLETSKQGGNAICLEILHRKRDVFSKQNGRFCGTIYFVNGQQNSKAISSRYHKEQTGNFLNTLTAENDFSIENFSEIDLMTEMSH